MPVIKAQRIAAFSSEDASHPAQNLLSSDTYRKWKCASAGEKQAVVVFQLQAPVQICSIDIGNEGSAFVEILVARSSSDNEDYKVLLVASSFMTPPDSKAWKNTNRVRMFGPDKLSKGVAEEKWDRVRVVCTQPYNKKEQYGLSFIALHSPPGESSAHGGEATPTTTPTPTTLGAFSLKEEPKVLPTGSLFYKKESTLLSSPGGNAAAQARSATAAALRSPQQFTSPQQGRRREGKERRGEEGKGKMTEDVKKEEEGSSCKAIMSGVVFTLSGFQNPYRSELREKMVEMGASYQPNWTDSCTRFDGEMVKWEQLQLNSFLYSQDIMSYKDALLKSLDSDGELRCPPLLSVPSSSVSNHVHPTTEMMTGGGCRGGMKQGAGSQSVNQAWKDKALKAECRGFVCSLFVECMDLLVASALDGNICVWGYDQQTVQVLKKMQQETLPPDDITVDQNEESSSVISRVVGFKCLHVLRGHHGCVQALAAVERWSDGGTYLISGGWDLAIHVWNLSTGSVVASLEESLPSSHQPHSNLIITSMAYSPHRKEFAYATSDGLVFVRRFALSPEDLHLVRTLNGHCSEVTQVCWNGVSGQWVTGSSDCTLRLWAGDVGEGGSGEADVCVSAGDQVSVVCVDQITGYIIAAVQSNLKVYNGDLELLQVSRGHIDVIRSIIHIPDRKQYMSSSWDGTVRVWKACN